MFCDSLRLGEKNGEKGKETQKKKREGRRKVRKERYETTYVRKRKGIDRLCSSSFQRYEEGSQKQKAGLKPSDCYTVKEESLLPYFSSAITPLLDTARGTYVYLCSRWSW